MFVLTIFPFSVMQLDNNILSGYRYIAIVQFSYLLLNNLRLIFTGKLNWPRSTWLGRTTYCMNVREYLKITEPRRV